MKKLLIFVILTLFLLTTLISQTTFELTFTAVDSAAYTQLDSIKIMNQTRGSDTVLYWPDTVLILYHVGINESYNNNMNFHVLQNYPNPVIDRTTIRVYIPEKGNVTMTISDVLGRQIVNAERVLNKGYHEFSFKPGDARIYFFTACFTSTSRSIKILNAGQITNGQCLFDYIGGDNISTQTKSTTAIQGFSFTTGDLLLYIGHTNSIQSGMQAFPEASNDYTFQFATNIPCPGTPTIDYGGQIYNTIQIYNQCWFKENLNVGIKINSSIMPTDNDTIEKYCFANSTYNCNNIWGGLYMWNEMMNYTYETGGQGICPDGWHVPDDLDWQILEGAVDSEFKIGDPDWENSQWRGMDAGGNLKQTGTTSWEPPNTGATDAFGFTALPAGYFVQNAFWGAGYKLYLYSSDNVNKYYRNIDWEEMMIRKGTGGGALAISVRCVKDN